jgi:hypothetical protein
MLGILATLVFAVGVDVFLFDGKYSQATEHVPNFSISERQFNPGR